MKLLIPVSDKKIKDPFWLRFTLLDAAENGRVKLIKNILSLVNHSDINSNEALARAMAYEHWKCVDLLTPFLKPENTDDILIKAAAKNRIKLVKILIPFSTEPTSKGWALRAAAENGHLQCVKLLIPVSDPKVKNTGIDGALIDAARNGDMKILKLLISISDPKIHSKSALQFAAEKGHTDIVKFLISISDPKSVGSQALFWAAENGHAECVKLLIPVSDPKLENSLALIRAAINGHTECVKLLFPVSNYNDALARLYKDNQNTTCLQPFIDEYQALKQNERLSNTLTNASAQHKNRKRKL